MLIPMRSTFSAIPVSVFLAAAMVASAPRSLAFDTVIIDAGHGGHDKGTYWGGLMEKTLTLDVAKRLEKILRGRGLRTVMTRTRDVFVPLPTRAAYGGKYSNSVFVSIHFNASRNRRAYGLETFYYSTKGKEFATRIQQHLNLRIRTRNRGIKRYPYHVLRNSKCTAILIENGFISNSWERKRCKSSSYRGSIAKGIAEGILNYRYYVKKYRKS